MLKTIWRLLSYLPTIREMNRLVIGLAEVAGIHLNPKTKMSQRLTTAAMIAVIAAATKALVRAQQATQLAKETLEPLKRENEQFKFQLQQLETADAQVDAALIELRDMVSTTPEEAPADIPAADPVETPPADIPAADPVETPPADIPAADPVETPPAADDPGPGERGPIGPPGPTGTKGKRK